MKTTLTKIRKNHPCESGWTKLLCHLGKTQADNEELSFITILESNGLDDALWCARSAPEYNRDWRLYAVWCASQVQHLMTDERSISALDVAERHANGQATDEELTTAAAAARAAAAAARDAAWAAAARNAAARDTAWAAAAWDAAWAAAARDAAARAAWAAAAWDAARDAAARDAAWAAAAWDAAWAASRDAQKEMFIQMCQGTAPWQVEEMK